MCRNITNLSYEQYQQHWDSKLLKRRHEIYIDFTVLFNAEERYALQLRHLSNKTQSGSVTRKSRIGATILLPFQQWSNLLKELTRSTHLYRHWILLDTSKYVNSNLLQQSLPIIDLLFEVFQQQQKNH